MKHHQPMHRVFISLACCHLMILTDKCPLLCRCFSSLSQPIIDCVASDNRPMRPFPAKSVAKKSGPNAPTPLHYAAINPNVKYLKQLVEVVRFYMSLFNLCFCYLCFCR